MISFKHNIGSFLDVSIVLHIIEIFYYKREIIKRNEYISFLFTLVMNNSQQKDILSIPMISQKTKKKIKKNKEIIEAKPLEKSLIINNLKRRELIIKNVCSYLTIFHDLDILLLLEPLLICFLVYIYIYLF